MRGMHGAISKTMESLTIWDVEMTGTRGLDGGEYAILDIFPGCV